MQEKRGKSVILLFLEIFLRITTSMKSSRRDLFIDMVDERFILKKSRYTPISPHTWNRCGAS